VFQFFGGEHEVFTSKKQSELAKLNVSRSDNFSTAPYAEKTLSASYFLRAHRQDHFLARTSTILLFTKCLPWFIESTFTCFIETYLRLASNISHNGTNKSWFFTGLSSVFFQPFLCQIGEY
jgi:hypothetical protein